MHRFDISFRRLRVVLAALAALGLMAFPAAASAKRHDHNHDGIPDKWEKRHHLSTKRHGVAKADTDKDGLKNRSEFKAHTNPRKDDSDRDGVGDADEDRDRDHVDNGNEQREHTHPARSDSDHDGVRDGSEDADSDRLDNEGEDAAETDPINPDSDGDGIKDGDERAGEVVSFDGETLTIRLFGGDTLRGIVDENTYIDCADGASDDSADDSGDDWSDDEGDDADDASADDDGDDADDADDDAGYDDSRDDEYTDDYDPDARVVAHLDGHEDEDVSDDEVSDDDASDDESEDWDDEDAGCSPDVLVPGAVVTEASVEATSEGTFFDLIELAG